MTSDEIIALVAVRGDMAYEGEGVTQLLHGWQTARLALRAHAAPSLQLAAWLHDLGHLMTDLAGTPTLRGVDDGHEHLAARVLSSTFGAEVAEPVALHVMAKRCLVGMRADYLGRLSADSVRSLALQGGPMAPAQVEDFLARPFARDAIRLRTWDDQAKDTRLQPDSAQQALEDLHALMRRVLAG